MTFEQIAAILKDKVVGIAGVGGLGSNAAVALLRVGIGKLVLTDFDVVEESNLNRQFYFAHQIGMKKTKAIEENLRLINPHANLEIHDVFLDAKKVVDIFKDCDVIIEAFDKAEHKQMIIETITSEMHGKPLVTGLGMAGYGAGNDLKVEQYGNLYICGDQFSEIDDDLPPLAPRVSIVANMQANTVLEILLNDNSHIK